MGLDSMDANPIPHLTSPLEGEEQDKLAFSDQSVNTDCHRTYGDAGWQNLWGRKVQTRT